MSWSQTVARLKDAGVDFAPGLTDDEALRVEERFGFTFPADLRALLHAGLPQGDRFPDWRDGSPEHLEEWLREPLEGILFDVEHSDFWLPEWLPRPDDLAEAFAHVRRMVEAAPRLIPVYGHRMMPDRPSDAGNPVFSVHQTDIICYGRDLEHYVWNEFLRGEEVEFEVPRSWKPIEFWDIARFQEVRWR